MPVKFVPLKQFAPDATPIGEASALIEATNFLPAFGNYRLLRRKNEKAVKALSYPVIGGLNHIFSATNTLQVGRFIVCRPSENLSGNRIASPMRLYKGDWFNQFNVNFPSSLDLDLWGDEVYPSKIVETSATGGSWSVDGPVDVVRQMDTDSSPTPEPTDGLTYDGLGTGTVKFQWDAKDLPGGIVDATHFGTTGSVENAGIGGYPIFLWWHYDGSSDGTLTNIRVKVDGLEVHTDLSDQLVGDDSTILTLYAAGRPRKNITVEFTVNTNGGVGDQIKIGGIAVYPLIADNDWVESVGAGSGLGSFLSLTGLEDHHNGGAGTLDSTDYGSTFLPMHEFGVPQTGDATIRFWYRVRNVKEDGNDWAIRWQLFEHTDPDMPWMYASDLKQLDSGLLTGSTTVDEWKVHEETIAITQVGATVDTVGGTTLNDTTDGWKRLILNLIPSADPNKAPDIFIDEDREAVYNNGWKTNTGNKTGLQDACRKKTQAGNAYEPATPATYIQSNAAEDGEAEVIFKLENNDSILSFFSDEDQMGGHLPVKIWGQFQQDGLDLEVTIYEDWEADDDDPDTENPTRVLKQWTAGIDGTDITASSTWQNATVNGETYLEWSTDLANIDDDVYVRDFNNLYLGIKVSVSTGGTQWQTYTGQSDGIKRGSKSTLVGAATATDCLSVASDGNYIDFDIGGTNNSWQPYDPNNALAGENYKLVKLVDIDSPPPNGTEARFSFRVKRDQARMNFSVGLYKKDQKTLLTRTTINPSDAAWTSGAGTYVTGTTKIPKAQAVWDYLRNESAEMYMSIEAGPGAVSLNDTASIDYLAFEYGADTIVKIANISVDQPSTTRIDIGEITFEMPAPETRKKSDEETLFVGTRDKLWTVIDGAWTDVSGTTYGSSEAPAMWCFAQWGNVCIATNGVDRVQGFNVGTDTQFDNFCETDADGSAVHEGYAPKAKYVAVVRPDVVVLANITGDGHPTTPNISSDGFGDYLSPDVVWWSGIAGGVRDTGNEHLANFTIPTADPPTGDMDNDAGAQRLRECPGEITGLLGGETALIFKRTGIWMMVYTGDPTFLFDFRLVTTSHGTPCHSSIVEVGNDVFFWTGSTFAVLQNRTNVVEIGQGVVRRMLSDIEFSDDAIVPPNSEDPAARELHVVGAYDRHSGIIFWAYSAPGDDPVVKNRVICFNPATQQWGFLEDSRLSITWLMRTNTIDTREEHLTKGLLGVDWDRSNASVFSFSGDGNYEGRLRTSIIPVLDGSEVQVNRIRPLYNVLTPGSPVTGPAGPLQITVSGRSGQEPTLTVGPQSETELGKDSDGWSIIRLNGEWHEFTFVYPESLDRPVTTDYGILGYHIEFDTDSGTGYGN